jgi:small-conductance mechanosensitive channel
LTKNVVLLTLVLFTGVAQSLQAQTFKVGDYVEYNGSACTVASLPACRELTGRTGS